MIMSSYARMPCKLHQHPNRATDPMPSFIPSRHFLLYTFALPTSNFRYTLRPFPLAAY